MRSQLRFTGTCYGRTVLKLADRVMLMVDKYKIQWMPEARTMLKPEDFTKANDG
jgi:hypothetical protein